MGTAVKYPDKTRERAGYTDIRNIPDCLLDGLQSCIVFFDADGVVFRINEMARKELGIAGDMEGRKLTDLIAITSCNKPVLPHIIAGFDDPAIKRMSVPRDAILSTGDYKMFFIAGTFSRLDCGNFLFSFRNVVDEMTNDSMVKLALGSTCIFPWFYDFALETMEIDPRYYEYTGIPARDNTMTLEEYASRVHPDDRDRVFQAMTMQLNRGRCPSPISFRLRRGDDTYEWFEEQSTYLGEVEGRPYRIVGVCMSTQAHKDVERALTEAKNRAEQSDMLKSAFLANMSHEIRTPLNAIVGFSELLTGEDADPLSAESREYASLISRNCEHLLTLVSDILDLSRIESESIEYDFTECSLGRLLRDIYEKKADSMPRDVEFSLQLPSDDIKITTETLRLRQVVEHLVSNAAKFTVEGHIGLGCSCSDDGRRVGIFVSDTGRGIPSDQIGKIFDRFYKVDNFIQGTGLGLSICQIIAAHLGGEIEVSSRLGEGSRFVLRLPVDKMK